MEKFKLSLNDLKVESFNTSEEEKASKGTVFANTGDLCINCPTSNEPSCDLTKPANGCNNNNTVGATCGSQHTCVSTCIETCMVSCAGDTCDVMTCDIIACGNPVTDGFQFYC
ncbi:MAG: pinensin family lanthipeptide [Rhodothermaceae bacterium]